MAEESKPRVLFVAEEAAPWGATGIMLDLAAALHSWGAPVRLLLDGGIVPPALEPLCLWQSLRGLLGGRLSAWQAAYRIQDSGFQPDVLHLFDTRLLVQAGVLSWLLGCKLVVSQVRNAPLSRARGVDLFLVTGESVRVDLVNNHGVAKDRVQLLPLGVSVPEKGTRRERRSKGPSPYDELIELTHQSLPLTGADTLLEREQRTPWQIGSRYLESPEPTPEPSASHLPVIAYKGPLREECGLPSLLRAFKLLADDGVAFHGLLIGKGPLRTELGHLVKELGLLETITFTPEYPPAMEPFDVVEVYVCPAECAGGEREILEAMAHGIAVVVTEIGGGYTILKEESLGTLLPDREPASLKEALAGLLKEHERRVELGSRAREHVASAHRLDSMVRAVVRAYSRLLGKEASAPIEL